ncbi:MAG: glycosyltransferase family 87 protein, partial [Hyphomicrobiaceae bacterium]
MSVDGKSPRRCDDAANKGPGGGWPTLLLATIGFVTIVITAHAALAIDRFDIATYVAMDMAHGALYLAAVLLVLNCGNAGARAFTIIFVVAIVLRGLAATPAPNLSTDAYRYVWDARIQAAGFNPYVHVPADPRLAHLRDAEIYPRINQKENAVTIYPPAAQLVFRAARAFDAGLEGIGVVMLLADAVIVLALLGLLKQLGQPRERVILYAWHPLPIYEIATQSHIDAAATAVLMLALLAAAKKRQALGGALLAVATLVKLFPVIAAPVLWRRWDWRAPAAFVGIAALLYAPFAWSAGGRVFGYLGRHLDNEGYAAGWGFHPIWLMRDLGIGDPPAAVYLALAALAMTGLSLWALVARAADDIRWQRLLLIGAGFVWLASPHYPWYFLF